MSAASSRDKRPERHAALAALLDAEGIDALLVTSRPNIRYLTGFSGSAGVVVATRTTQLLVTDFRYDEQARQQSGAVARVEIEGTSVWDRLFKELPTVTSGTLSLIGFEAHAITVKDVRDASEHVTFEVNCDLHPVDAQRCSRDTSCSIRPVWRMLEQRINELLSGISLADLMHDEPEVYQIAGVTAGN